MHIKVKANVRYYCKSKLQNCSNFTIYRMIFKNPLEDLGSMCCSQPIHSQASCITYIGGEGSYEGKHFSSSVIFGKTSMSQSQKLITLKLVIKYFIKLIL